MMDNPSRTSLRPEASPAGPVARFLLQRFANYFSASPVAFDLILPDGSRHRLGAGTAAFSVTVKNRAGFTALGSIDEGRIGSAYVAGDLDIDGDMLQPFALRQSMGDKHPVTSLWRFVQPLLFGQVHTNRQAISAHYDIDPKFFLSFLDPVTPCYTQGIYLDPAETLDVATLRKFAYCFAGCALKPGDHMLEIGPGWGAWMEYAAGRGVRCTGITNSEMSQQFLTKRAKQQGIDWEIIFSDLLEYESSARYDAIVIMGVIEHLPNYPAVLQKFLRLLRPGGRIFLDASAATKKYELSSFMVKYIYGGNHSFLVLHDFLQALAATPLRVTELYNDRYSYFLTFQQWARNFDDHREEIIRNFGDFNYRRFRLYLWGAAYEFQSRSLDCYRMIIEYPS